MRTTVMWLAWPAWLDDDDAARSDGGQTGCMHLIADTWKRRRCLIGPIPHLQPRGQDRAPLSLSGPAPAAPSREVAHVN